MSGDRSQSDPDSQSQPFVAVEVPWHTGEHFHQDHSQTYATAHNRNDTLASISHNSVVRGASGQDSRGSGYRSDLSDRHKNRVPKKHASGRGTANQQHG